MPEHKVLHYQILDTLGKGGMGTVYRALDTRLERQVALKFLNSETIDQQAKERLRVEARAAAKLDHPNIGAIYSIEEVADQLFIVMALYEGQSLEAMLEEATLQPNQALDIAMQAGRGLARAHQRKLIHRDIKPANLFITRDGLVKVLDFGLAKLDEADGLTSPGTIMGTAEYMAPEQVRAQAIDQRVDVWALGVVLYEMLTGESPFKTESWTTTVLQVLSKEPKPATNLRPDLPEDLDYLITRALAKDREERYGFKEEMLADLEALAGKIAGATRPSALALQQPKEPSALIPATAASSPAHNLPAPQTSLVGREEELAAITLRLSDPQCRILTLVGPGGTGKTRLAVEAAHEQRKLAQFKDGVYFVPLDALTDAELIPSSIADAFKINLQEHEPALAQVIHHLGDMHFLLVLDNYEQLIAGSAVAAELVQNCPHLKLLVTSRERLNLVEETTLDVQGLSFPDADTPLDAALQMDAVKLFLSHATRVQPSFKLDASTLKHVQRLCQLAAGMPLALELAAAWLDMLPVDELADELARTADILATESVSLPTRQRSMRALVEYSWSLLTAAEQDTLPRLAVFRGGFTKEAAAFVAGANLLVLRRLVNKSLLRADTQGRFDCHMFLQQYYLEKLGDTILQETLDKHREYFLNFATAQTSANALELLDKERDNIRAAWTGASHVDELMSFVKALETFLRHRGYRHDQLTLAKHALDAARKEQNPTATAELLNLSADLFLELGSLHEAQMHLDEALALAQSLRDTYHQAKTLFLLGELYHQRGDLATALTHLEQSLERFRSVGDRHEEANLLHHIGRTHFQQGDYGTTIKYFKKALEIHREAHDVVQQALLLNNLGEVSRIQGDAEKAIVYYEKALELHEQAGDLVGKATTLSNRSLIARQQGDYPRSLQAYHEVQQLCKTMDDQLLLAKTLNNRGNVHQILGDLQQAQDCFEEAIRIQETLNDRFNLVASLCNLSAAVLKQGQVERARVLAEDALEQAIETGFQVGQAYARNFLGDALKEKGELDKALQLYEEALSLHHQVGNRSGMVMALTSLGSLQQQRQQAEEAIAQLQEAITLALELQLPYEELLARRNLASVYEETRNIEGAQQELERVVSLATTLSIPGLEEDRKAIERVKVLQDTIPTIS